jgi:4-amino-4-deoxy-L-arabinose transferase-like glycosyltransferase
MHSPTGSVQVPAGEVTRLQRQAVSITMVATALRMALAATLPLVADEAYYWEWSRHLAFGYFDHPPLIAWLVAFGTAVFGDTTLGVRFFPVLCGAIAAFALAESAERLAGARAARFAALLLAATPFTIGFVLATPDAPLLAAVSVTLMLVLRALEPEATARQALVAWAGAGVAIGLAMASKFTAVFVPFALLLACAIHPALRVQLKRPGPYVAVLVASLVMVPVLQWNAQHEWIAFRFQLGHGLNSVSNGSWWQRELELLGGQLGLVTPILFVLLVRALWRDYAPNGEPRRFALAQVALFCLGFFIYSATRRRVEANWPAIGWLPTLALLAAATQELRSVWERRAMWLAGGLTALMLAHVAFPFLPIAARKDPAARLRGWDALVTVAAPASESPNEVEPAARRSAPAGSRFLAAARYQEAALLAWHDPQHPDVTAINLLGRRNQYDLWPRFQDRAQPGATLVLIVPDTSAHPALVDLLRPHFASATRGALTAVTYRGDTLTMRRAWTLDGWRGTWPADPNDPLKNR